METPLIGQQLTPTTKVEPLTDYEIKAMDKTLTPSPWTTPMDYPNGLPLKWTTPKK